VKMCITRESNYLLVRFVFYSILLCRRRVHPQAHVTTTAGSFVSSLSIVCVCVCLSEAAMQRVLVQARVARHGAMHAMCRRGLTTTSAVCSDSNNVPPAQKQQSTIMRLVAESRLFATQMWVRLCVCV
jgi:hypothetical protein